MYNLQKEINHFQNVSNNLNLFYCQVFYNAIYLFIFSL